MLDLVTLDASGSLKRISAASNGGSPSDPPRWSEQQLGSWADRDKSSQGPYRLFLADLDNNGALDIAASGGGRFGVWLAGESGDFQRLPGVPEADVFEVVDLNGDGQLDFVGLAADGPFVSLAKARKTTTGTCSARARSRRPAINGSIRSVSEATSRSDRV